MLKNKQYLYRTFSIILPVLNEEKNIEKLISLIKKYLKNYKYELIFVDDNSTDNTKKIITSYVSKNIKYYLRTKNKDLTLSCFLGIQKSKYQNIIIMDSDLQHHPRYLSRMIDLFFKKKLDFVVAVRNFNEDIGLGIIRKFSSIFLSNIFKFFLGYKVSDPMSGFFMFKKLIYYKYKNHLFGKGWKILADLIYNKENFLIEQVQVKFLSRSGDTSKMNLNVLINVMRLFLFKLRMLKI
jgi:dolichol-phosphate mannosyltransferase